MTDDQQLRDELQRAVPRVVNTPAWSEIETRGRRARRRRRSVLALATTVVLLAVGAGGYALWDALRPATTLLITDEMPAETAARPANGPRAVYLAPSTGAQLTPDDLRAHPEVIVVHDQAGLEAAAQGRTAIWIDKASVDRAVDKASAGTVDMDWLRTQYFERHDPIVLVGYGNSLYAFREVLEISGIRGPYVDWKAHPPALGFSTVMLLEATDQGRKAFMQSSAGQPTAGAILEVTDRLLRVPSEGPAASATATTAGGTLDPERSQLLSDIQALMSRLDRGELVIDWPLADAAEGAYGLFSSYQSASQALYALGQQVLRGDAHLVIYLKDGVDQEAARQLAEEIRSASGVVWVKYVSKDEALARLKEDLKEDHPELLAPLAANPLPASIEAFVPDLTDRKRLAESMSARAEVDEVRYPEAGSIQTLREAFQQLQERARPAGSTSSTSAP